MGQRDRHRPQRCLLPALTPPSPAPPTVDPHRPGDGESASLAAAAGTPSYRSALPLVSGAASAAGSEAVPDVGFTPAVGSATAASSRAAPSGVSQSTPSGGRLIVAEACRP